MSKEFKLPELGENIESAGVVSVLVKKGDKIQKDQSIIEIETDKATIEVPAESAGVIKDVLVKPGDQLKVGQTMIVIDEESGTVKTEKGTDGQDKLKSTAAPEEKRETGKDKPNVDEVAAPTVKKAPGEEKIVEVSLPELGENIESADVLSVLVKAGDTLIKDQGIIEIETDKATIEVPSNIEGKITEVLIKPGDKAKVGQVLIKVQTEGAAAEAKEQTARQEAKKEVPREEKNEEPEKQQEAPVKKEPETEGKKTEFQPGEIDHQPPIKKNAAPAAPSVRRIARELGVDINDVPGTGPGSRISMNDVKDYVKKLNEQRSTGTGPGVKKEALPDFSKYGSVQRKPMSKIRSVTADHLSYAWATIPHVTQHDKADITELEEIRKQLNPKVEKAGGKLTVTGVLVMIAAAALKRFPQFNTSIDLEKHEIIQKDYFNVGIAVDTENGLIVPVIRNADKKGLTDISVELTALAERARNKKVTLEDLQGGCFTITNLGGIGGTYFTPIVNAPEVAILGVSRGKWEPVYKEGEFVPKLMLPLSLSYDHRVIDGADAARFLRYVCETLEQPINLILE